MGLRDYEDEVLSLLVRVCSAIAASFQCLSFRNQSVGFTQKSISFRLMFPA